MTRFATYKNSVSLVPGGPIQFLDIPINITMLPKKVQSDFWEYYDEETERYVLKALKLDKDKGEYQDRQTQDAAVDPRNNKKIDPYYSINVEKCLEPFLGKWVPVPFLRTEPSPDSQEQSLKKALSNWARVRIAALPEGDVDGYTHVLTFAFDVNVENEPDEGTIAPALTESDVHDSADMVLADDVSQYAWFLGEEWVDAWIQGLFVDLLKSKRPGRPLNLEDRDYHVEHIARYITFLDLLKVTDVVPDVRLINTTQTNRPIEVDLVLDVGNSRTCGMLIERSKEGTLSLENSYVLELRDLSAPENRYGEPFSSNICFSKSKFGDPNDLSFMSGRETDPFDWPSLVRVGPEAERLASISRQEDGQTSMSSPKRYLWDEKPREQEWRYCADPQQENSYEEPVNTGTFALCINDQGTPTDHLGDRSLKRNKIFRTQSIMPVTQPRFSRSSVMMFMLSEVLLQALVSINSPAQRNARLNPDIPRRLQRLIITVPAAMPIAERNIFKRWANFAVSTLWKSLGWSDSLELQSDKPSEFLDFREPPTVLIEWDEATSTQMVFLYNEIADRFAGDVDNYFELKGQHRSGYGNDPSLRVASIDVGGGTSDLIVTTYEKKQAKGPMRPLEPHVEFREGFNIAGDEILKKVIEQHFVLPLGNALSECGISSPEDFLTQAMGRDMLNQSERSRKMRGQFVKQIATVFGLYILRLSEACDLSEGDVVRTISFEEVFKDQPAPGPDAIELIDDGVRRAGGSAFSIRDFEYSVDLAEVFTTISTVIAPVLIDLCEIIQSLNCDLLVISGRPSALPAVQAAILNHAPLAPDRIQALSKYKIGKWYPYWSSGGRIKDPKTTVSVGAMLCMLASGRLSNFNMQTGNLKPKSTARFIGLMDQNGRMSNSDLLFEGIDLETDAEKEKVASIEFHGPTKIGFRQLGLARWTVTPFYSLDYTENVPDNIGDTLPLNVEIAYKRPEDDDDAPGNDLNDEGVFTIEGYESEGDHQPPRGCLELKLMTLLDEQGYWLDTGKLDIPEIQ